MLARVPIQDWVLVAEGDELLDFGGLSAAQFLAKRDREVRWNPDLTCPCACPALPCPAQPNP